MDIKDFYDFGSKYSSTTIQAYAEGLNTRYTKLPEPTEIRIFDQDKLIYADYEGIKFPVVFKQDSGKQLRDMLDTGWPSFYLISDKMKAVLEDNNLTGWRTFSIIVLGKKGEEIKGYHGFSTTGRCGPIDYSKCEIIEKRLVPQGPLCKYYKGLYVGLDKWDGTDFFLPEGNSGTIVTTKAAVAIKKAKLTNVQLENLAEFETADFTVEMIMKRRSAAK